MAVTHRMVSAASTHPVSQALTTAPERLTTVLADRYRIERQLGQGGMATVYLAQDLKHEREVALKVLRPELGAYSAATDSWPRSRSRRGSTIHSSLR
jgi:serine/threonine protein kinase